MCTVNVKPHIHRHVIKFFMKDLWQTLTRRKMFWRGRRSYVITLLDFWVSQHLRPCRDQSGSVCLHVSLYQHVSSHTWRGAGLKSFYSSDFVVSEYKPEQASFRSYCLQVSWIVSWALPNPLRLIGQRVEL